MSLGLAIVASIAKAVAPPQPFPVQFAAEITGQQVYVSIDGGRVRQTFAGKLGFIDRNGQTVASHCCDVRSPVQMRQTFNVQMTSTIRFGGNVTRAGNIVAKHFSSAKTSAQAAGLQLAVWEAIEDGGGRADFSAGRFRAAAGDDVIRFAEGYYQAIAEPGNAVILRTTSNKGQSQIFPWPNDAPIGVG